MKPDDSVPSVPPEQGFALTTKERELLLRAIAEADRGEVVDGWGLLNELED